MPNFAPAEIIALVSVLATVIIAIGGGIERFFTNRANNRAKLTELAYERRLEALRSVYAALSRLNVVLTSTSLGHLARLRLEELDSKIASNKKQLKEMGREVEDESEEREDDIQRLLELLEEDYLKRGEDFRNIYMDNRVYIPIHIDRMLKNYISEMQENSEMLYRKYPSMREKPKMFADNINTMTQTILEEIRKFIGYE